MTRLLTVDEVAETARDDQALGLGIRVRQTYVRGQFKPPKSKRGRRGVPLAIRVVGELEGYFGVSAYKDDDDLVFANPHIGCPLDRTKVRKRFQAACRGHGRSRGSLSRSPPYVRDPRQRRLSGVDAVAASGTSGSRFDRS